MEWIVSSNSYFESCTFFPMESRENILAEMSRVFVVPSEKPASSSHHMYPIHEYVTVAYLERSWNLRKELCLVEILVPYKIDEYLVAADNCSKDV